MQSYHTQNSSDARTENKHPMRMLLHCAIMGGLPSAFYHVFSFTGESDLRIMIWVVLLSTISVGVVLLMTLSEEYKDTPRKPIVIIESIGAIWASGLLILYALGFLFTFLGLPGHSSF